MALTAGQVYRRALTNHWGAYALGFVMMLITSVTEVLTPKFVQWSLDTISPEKGAAVPAMFVRDTSVETLRALILGLGITLVCGWIGRTGWRETLARRTHMAGRELKVRMWDVLRFLPLKTFHDYPLGDLMNRATGDWNSSRFIHGFTLVLTFDLVFFTILALGSMFLIDVELTLYCLLVFPFLPRLVVRLARREHDQHAWAQEKLSHLSDLISQSLGTIRLQRATASDAVWQRALSESAREYARRRYEVVKTGWKIFPLGAAPTLFAYAVLLIWGVRKIQAGVVSPGEFVALQSYVLLLQVPLFELGDCIAEWQKGFASLSRIVEIFNLQGMADLQLRRKARPKVSSEAARPVIEIERLSHSYDGKRQVLQDVSLSIYQGESVGLTGPIGSGKSTLLDLVGGLVDAPKGAVRLFGTDVSEIGRDWLTSQVTVVPQRAFLFAGSIRFNLELDESFSEEELWRVLEIVRLDGDVRGFESGIDTWIGEWGVNLSGGQKQRLALARALLRPRKVLLLDDCLSAVDAITEEHILSRIRGELKDLTVIWVAHRLSTLKLCDRIYRLDAGRLSEVRRAELPQVLKAQESAQEAAQRSTPKSLVMEEL